MRKSLALLLFLLLLIGTVGCGKAPVVQKYTLTLNIDGNGSVTPASGSEFKEATIVKLIPTPTTGWVFDSWTGPNRADVLSAAGEHSISMNANKNITAVFIKLQYDVMTNVFPANGGTVEIVVDPINPAGIKVEYEQTVKLTATAAAGFIFDHWEGDLTGTNNPQNKLITQNTTITAVFRPLPSQSISGVVRGVNSQQPIAGVIIEYYGAANGQVETDANGFYAIPNVSGPLALKPKPPVDAAWVDSYPTSMQVVSPKDDANFSVSVIKLDSIWKSDTTDPIAKPTGIDVDATGNVYIAERNTCKVKQFNSSGELQNTWLARIPDKSTCNTFALHVDSFGNVYVAVNATGANNIQKFSSNGTLLFQFGNWGN